MVAPHHPVRARARRCVPSHTGVLPPLVGGGGRPFVPACRRLTIFPMAVWLRTWSELRTRWRAALSLALLVGVSGGVVMAASAGARRTHTAYTRFVAAPGEFPPQTVGLNPAIFTTPVLYRSLMAHGDAEGKPPTQSLLLRLDAGADADGFQRAVGRISPDAFVLVQRDLTASTQRSF